jgi:hypothetical protein
MSRSNQKKTFTVTASPAPVLTLTLNPVSGPVGKSVKVTGTGFGANETVKIYLDSTSRGLIIGTRANAAGEIGKTITIPSTPNGQHKIIAVGQTTDRRKTATFTVTDPPTPKLSAVSPTSGPAGTTVRVSGRDYRPGETVNLYIDSTSGAPKVTAVASSSGSISATIIMPDLVGGKHLILAVGQTSKNKTSIPFTLTPTVTILPTSGQNRATLTVQAKGFTANEPVKFFWDGSSTSEGGATTDSKGVATFTVRGPWTNGAHTGVIRGLTSRLEDSVTYTVVAFVKLTPSTGDVNTDISIRGTGFKAGTAINIYWNTATSSNLICSTRSSDDLGTFTCTASPPANGRIGANTIIAAGGGVTASATFTLTAPSANAAVVTTTPESSPAAGGDEPATATPTGRPDSSSTPTAEVTATPDQPSPTETAEPEVTETPEPQQVQVVLIPVADTSVSAATPDEAGSGEGDGTLSAGGQDGALALVTFQVDGIAAGTIINATLVLTGAGDAAGPAGGIRALNGFVVDESSLTYSAVSLEGVPPALDANGNPAGNSWIEPGVETTIDVTGSVTADGFITFAIPGTVEQEVAFGSRASGSPPRLIVEVLK